MADFRRWFTVLAVLAVMAGAASAQVGVAQANGSANGVLACVANAAGTPELRPESYTELIGDILISCTGGPDLTPGTLVPTTNIVVYMNSQVPITSRLLGSANPGPSEALLIIDDAGSINFTSGAPGWGPQESQSPCTSAQQQTTPSPCTAYVGIASGLNTAGNAVNYQVSVTGTSGAGATTAAPNVYQGRVGDFGVQTVAFYNVPVLPPATSGVSRTFRITNIRIPSVSAYIAVGAQAGAFISTSPSQVLPITQSQLQVGVVGPSTKSSVNTPTAFQQCIPQTNALAATITFTEGFATAFKTRVVPGGASNTTSNTAGNTTYAAEAQNFGPGNNQNIPGGLYGGFAANSESGFIYPGLSATVGGNTYYSGLADFGTRLKAVFTNIPTGLTLYVSTTSINNASPPAVIGGTSTSSFAVLVAVNGSDYNSDGSPFTPITSSNNLYAVNAPSNGGEEFAEWEVTNSNPSAIDVLQFGIYISYTPASATAANPYGTPITNPYPLGAPIPSAALSFAPEPSDNDCTPTGCATALVAPVPRFAVVLQPNPEWPILSIGLCQTTLLYPFVTAASGFDTGIAVANTSMDPFHTTNQTGSCTLYGYGITAATTVASQPVVPGCDTIQNPLPGTNCFGGPGTSNVIPPGQVGTIDAASSQLAGFQGYVIAVCNFQYAHGYAAVTDLGVRNLWSSYLALELANIGAGVSPRKGISSIEALVH